MLAQPPATFPAPPREYVIVITKRRAKSEAINCLSWPGAILGEMSRIERKIHTFVWRSEVLTLSPGQMLSIPVKLQAK